MKYSMYNMYIDININNFNVYNYLSEKKIIKYSDINKYSGSTYDLDYDIIWTNYKMHDKLIIKSVNSISIYIPYKKLILHNNVFDERIIEKIFNNLKNICNSKIVCSFNIGFWKSIINSEIIEDVILKLTQKTIFIDKTIINNYIEISRKLKYLFKEEIISMDINGSLFLI